MREFLERVKRDHPEHFWRVRVLDCGSLDINGCNRDLWNLESGYTGIDLGPGKNVNMVMAIEDADWREGHFHCIISTECFEHNPNWRSGLLNMVRMLRPGGLLIVTCATIGRDPHGVPENSPYDSPYTLDNGYYKNLTEQDIRAVINADDFEHFEFAVNEESHDLYFHAVKRGDLVHGCTCDDLNGKNKEQKQWMNLEK
jgi:SAM-dependent methyltransferase